MLKKLIITASLLAVGFVALLGFNHLPSMRVRAQLNLGQKYLEEMQYEDALLAFQSAIDIDEKNVPAYLGVVDVYLGMVEKVSAEENASADDQTQKIEEYLDEAEKVAAQAEKIVREDSPEDSETVEQVEERKKKVHEKREAQSETSEQAGEPAEPASESESKEEAEEDDELQKMYSAYADVLRAYRTYYESGKNEEVLTAAGLSEISIYKNLEGWMNLPDKFFYALEDLNGDGKEELIIFFTPEDDDYKILLDIQMWDGKNTLQVLGADRWTDAAPMMGPPVQSILISRLNEIIIEFHFGSSDSIRISKLSEKGRLDFVGGIEGSNMWETIHELTDKGGQGRKLTDEEAKTFTDTHKSREISSLEATDAAIVELAKRGEKNATNATEPADTTEARKAYRDILLSMADTYKLPSGEPFPPCEDNWDDSAVERFAVLDIDNDGQEELLVAVSATGNSMFGCDYYVWAYEDGASLGLRTELTLPVSSESDIGMNYVNFFTNGTVLGDIHTGTDETVINQLVYTYNAASDTYVADKDFYINTYEKYGTFEAAMPTQEYQDWSAQFAGMTTIDITWTRLSRSSIEKFFS